MRYITKKAVGRKSNYSLLGYSIRVSEYFTAKQSRHKAEYNLPDRRNKVKTVRLTVAIPCVRLGDGAPALHTDRGHSLPSLPPATGGGRVAPYLLRYAQSVK